MFRKAASLILFQFNAIANKSEAKSMFENILFDIDSLKLIYQCTPIQGIIYLDKWKKINKYAILSI